MPKKKAAPKKPKAKPLTVKNTGREYELFTKDVFAQMEDLQNVGATFQHDVLVTGKTGVSHQIDVLVEYELAGTKYRVVIQCKDWGSRVKKAQVMEFHDVLNDIPGQPRGIFVAKSGFQDGAKIVGKHHGIELYELREKRDEDWEGLIHTIEMRLTLVVPRFDNFRVDLDFEWARQQLRSMGIAESTYSPMAPGGKSVSLESGKVVLWGNIFGPYLPEVEGVTKRVSLQFHRDRPMLDLLGFPLPRVPCIMVHADLSISLIDEPIRVEFNHFVAYCFKDVIADRQRFLDADGGTPTPQSRRVEAHVQDSE